MDLRNEVKKQLVDGVIHPLLDLRKLGLYGVEASTITVSFWDIEQCTCEIWDGSDMVSKIELTVPGGEAWSLGALMGDSLSWLQDAETAMLADTDLDYAAGSSTYNATLGRAVGCMVHVDSGEVTWNLAGLATFATAGNGFAVETMAPGATSTKLSLSNWRKFGRYQGDSTGSSTDAQGELLALITSISDASASRLMTQERGNYSYRTTDGIAYNGPCVLKAVNITKGAAGDCVIHDGVDTNGAVSATIDGTTANQWNFGVIMSTGIYVNLTTNQHVTVVYEPV